MFVRRSIQIAGPNFAFVTFAGRTRTGREIGAREPVLKRASSASRRARLRTRRPGRSARMTGRSALIPTIRASTGSRFVMRATPATKPRTSLLDHAT
jgi:hypothetical protein